MSDLGLKLSHVRKRCINRCVSAAVLEISAKNRRAVFKHPRPGAWGGIFFRLGAQSPSLDPPLTVFPILSPSARVSTSFVWRVRHWIADITCRLSSLYRPHYPSRSATYIRSLFRCVCYGRGMGGAGEEFRQICLSAPRHFMLASSDFNLLRHALSWDKNVGINVLG